MHILIIFLSKLRINKVDIKMQIYIASIFDHENPNI